MPRNVKRLTIFTVPPLKRTALYSARWTACSIDPFFLYANGRMSGRFGQMQSGNQNTISQTCREMKGDNGTNKIVPLGTNMTNYLFLCLTV